MAHQVADLVDQFVRLDAFLMDFIFEAALKLASLTDGQLFMMIETSEGRRFAGKEHLCDLYLTGGLKPIGREMKYHLDSYDPSISKELVDPPPPPPPPPPATHRHHQNSSFTHESDLLSSNASSTAVMPIASSSSSSSSSKSSLKRSRNRDSAAAAAASMMSPPKLAKLSSSSLLPADDFTNGAEASTNDSRAMSSAVKTLEVKREAEDEEIYLIEDEEGMGGGGGGGSRGGDLSDLDFAAVDFDGSAGEMQLQLQQQGQLDLDSFNSTAFDESHDSVSNNGVCGVVGDVRSIDNFVVDVVDADERLESYMREIRDFLASCPKAAALRAMSLDVKEQLGTKGSAAYKIMTSLIYELGTMAACRVLHLPVQHPFLVRYRGAILELLVDTIPIFALLDDEKFHLFEGPRRKNMMSFLKETLNRFFRNRLTKEGKRGKEEAKLLQRGKFE